MEESKKQDLEAALEHFATNRDQYEETAFIMLEYAMDTPIYKEAFEFYASVRQLLKAV